MALRSAEARKLASLTTSLAETYTSAATLVQIAIECLWIERRKLRRSRKLPSLVISQDRILLGFFIVSSV